MIGELRFRHAPDGYVARYRGPREPLFRELCPIVRATGQPGWIAKGNARVYGPARTRREAARLLLDDTYGREAAAIETRVEKAWKPFVGRRSTPLTPEVAQAIYDVLVEKCGAANRPDDRESFAFHMTRHTGEYRFCGMLGFGGKFWNENGKVYVNCYKEDEDAESRLSIAKANDDLQRIFIGAAS